MANDPVSAHREFGSERINCRTQGGPCRDRLHDCPLLEHDRGDRTLLVTPGGGAARTPACTVSLSFDNYLKIQTGKQSTKWLFVTRKLRVKGDLAHAALLDPLLG